MNSIASLVPQTYMVVLHQFRSLRCAAGAARGRCGPRAWRQRSADPPPAFRHRPFPGSFAGKQTWPARETTRTLRTTWETTCRFCLVTSGTGAWPWVETEALGGSRREDEDRYSGAAASGKPLVCLARRSPALSSRPVSWVVRDVGATDFGFPEQGPHSFPSFPQAGLPEDVLGLGRVGNLVILAAVTFPARLLFNKTDT